MWLFRNHDLLCYKDDHSKKNVLNEAVTAFQVIKIKVSETSNQLAIGDVKLTTATEALLKSCSVDKAGKENFHKDCVKPFF